MFRPVRDEANKDVLSFPIDLPVGQVLYGRIFSTGGYYPATFYGVVPEHLAISQMRGMTAIQAGSFAPESPMPSVAARQP